MKKTPWLLGIALVALVLFGLSWIVRGRLESPSTHLSSGSLVVVNTAAAHPPAAPPAPDPSVVSQNEWNELRATRDATLQANPDLAAKYKELMEEMKAQQARFDAAMIKADPKVAPIVAKFIALRESALARGPSPMSARGNGT